MLKACLGFLMVLAPALTLLGTGGCEEKTVHVQQSDQRHESEPKMVSPGEEVVE